MFLFAKHGLKTNLYIATLERNFASRTDLRVWFTIHGMRAQSTYIYRVQSSVWRLPNYWPPTPSPPSECVLPPHQRRGVHTRQGVGDVVSIFRKTPDIGLASYSIIPLRMRDRKRVQVEIAISSCYFPSFKAWPEFSREPFSQFPHSSKSSLS